MAEEMIYPSTTKPVSSLLEDSNFFDTKMHLCLMGLIVAAGRGHTCTHQASYHCRHPPTHTAEIYNQTGLTGSQDNRDTIRGALIADNVRRLLQCVQCTRVFYCESLAEQTLPVKCMRSHVDSNITEHQEFTIYHIEKWH